jgi:hypothetical protein
MHDELARKPCFELARPVDAYVTLCAESRKETTNQAYTLLLPGDCKCQFWLKKVGSLVGELIEHLEHNEELLRQQYVLRDSLRHYDLRRSINSCRPHDADRRLIVNVWPPGHFRFQQDSKSNMCNMTL